MKVKDFIQPFRNQYEDNKLDIIVHTKNNKDDEKLTIFTVKYLEYEIKNTYVSNMDDYDIEPKFVLEIEVFEEDENE